IQPRNFIRLGIAHSDICSNSETEFIGAYYFTERADVNSAFSNKMSSIGLKHYFNVNVALELIYTDDDGLSTLLDERIGSVLGCSRNTQAYRA
ncbi:MAG: hypothetical protein AAGJ37_05725, partial [Pseudomonadota bacterium]